MNSLILKLIFSWLKYNSLNIFSFLFIFLFFNDFLTTPSTSRDQNRDKVVKVILTYLYCMGY